MLRVMGEFVTINMTIPEALEKQDIQVIHVLARPA
jgi:hypothetical protein